VVRVISSDGLDRSPTSQRSRGSGPLDLSLLTLPLCSNTTRLRIVERGLFPVSPRYRVSNFPKTYAVLLCVLPYGNVKLCMCTSVVNKSPTSQELSQYGSDLFNSINKKPCRDAIYRVSTSPESQRKILNRTVLGVVGDLITLQN
jgi:hypothetical protein